METSQPFVPPVEKQVNPPQYVSSKRPLILVLIVIIFIVAVFGVYISSKQKNPEVPSKVVTPTQPSEKPTVVITPPFTSITLTPQKQSLIIYLKEANIWSVKTDGTSLRQLTRDGDDKEVRYQALSFKGKEKIGFARCSSPDFKCEIVSKNLTTGEEKVEYNSQENVISIAWNSKETQLAFIGSNGEGISALTLLTQDSPKRAVVFESGLGRGGGLDDEISLKYSADDNYLVAVNTVTQPNIANNETTIWIINKNGEIQSSVSKKFATDAFWESPTNIIYRSGNTLYKKTVSGVETELGSVDGVDTTLTEDKKNIIFWNTSDDGTTSVKSFSLDSKTTTEIIKNIIYTKSSGASLVIGIKSTPSSEDYFGFSTGGLVSYNISTSEEHLLDNNTSISQLIIN